MKKKVCKVLYIPLLANSNYQIKIELYGSVTLMLKISNTWNLIMICGYVSVILGLLVVKYIKELIMPLYIVESIDLPCLSFSSLMDELIGVPIVFTSSILNLLKRSLMYLS